MANKDFFEKTAKQFKYILVRLGLPSISAAIYVLSPSNSIMSLIMLGILGYLLSLLIQPKIASNTIKSEVKPSKTKKNITALMLLNVLPISTYFLFYLTIVMILKSLTQ